MAIANYQLFISDAQKVAQQTGVPASVTLAQLILESSGKYENNLSSLGANYKNLFGVKGSGTAGSVSLPTTEYVNGKYVTQNANFRVYNSYYESILDHAKVLLNDRYTKHTANASNIGEYIQGVAKGGYATDPSYASKLKKIITDYNLTQYDVDGTVSGADFRKLEENSISNTGSTSTTAGDTVTDRNSFAEQIMYNIMRIGGVLLLLILCIIFFMKAFPTVENVATNVVPQAKILKGAKALTKVKKGAKAVGKATNSSRK